MTNKKILNFSYIEIFLILSYTICWFSISTSFYDIIDVFEKLYDLKKDDNFSYNFINFFRQLVNLILFPILLIIFFKKYRNIEFKNELLFIFAFFYFFFQIPGLFFTENSIANISYVISALNILFIFILINIYFDKKKYFIFFYITFLMLILVSILNYKAYINFFSQEDSSTLYTFFQSSETFLGKHSPRSTGSSRSLLLIMISSFLIFYNFFEKKKFLKHLLYIIISTLILLFQSRTTIALLIIFILMNFIYEKKFSIKEIIKYFFIYIILPIIFLYSILTLKQLAYNQEFFINFNNGGIKQNISGLTDDFKRPIDPRTYSSGRVEDWKNLLSKVNKSPIYGYGAQGDRFLINQTASNGMIYAFSSTGILGFTSFIFFSLLSLWIITKKFLESLKFNLLISFYISITVLLLLARSILESSYALFSIDFIILYTFINYLNKFSLKKDGN